MTRLFGVIGSPIGHSLSPVMHTAALRALRVDGVYSPFEVPPRFLRPILRALALAGVEGLNVTVPLKERVMPLLDHVDTAARAIGAVNTIVVHGRRLTGYNTDTRGFSLALRELGWRPKGVPPAPALNRGGPGSEVVDSTRSARSPRSRASATSRGIEGRPRSAHAVILGAGGAARAVTWELARTGVSRLTIANRRRPRAQRLARWISRLYPRIKVQVISLSQVDLEDADLLINATPVGIRAVDSSPIDLASLQPRTAVYDLVYHRETPLIRMARRRGCVAANGVSMLLYQGAESLRLWLERPPPVGVMRAALEQAISRSR